MWILKDPYAGTDGRLRENEVDRRIDKAALFDNLQKRTGDTNIHRSISLRESGNNIHLLANNNRSIIPRQDRVGTGLNGACARVRQESLVARSEERSEGKECVSTCRTRRSPSHKKNKTIKKKKETREK